MQTEQDEDNFCHWAELLRRSPMASYLAIPEILAEDMRNGRLSPRDRLPPLRILAELAGVNYTTMVRGIKEAGDRGLVASRPGLGTYVRGSSIGLPLRVGAEVEMSMNLPPEVEESDVLSDLQASAAETLGTSHLHDLMRYQEFGGTIQDRRAAANWLRSWLPEVGEDQVLVAPGIHSVLLALVSMLTGHGRSLCVESLTYPGIKAISAQYGVPLVPLSMDHEGVLPDEFNAACKRTSVGALYLCPNLHNPTTGTLSIDRREALIKIAREHQIPIIEDDAYGMLPPALPPSISDLAPDITYYVTGLSKCLGAGLRTAYVVAPTAEARIKTASALRATTVMASPFVNAVVTRWLEAGQAQKLLTSLRKECAFRSELVRQKLGAFGVRTHPYGFHAWLPMPHHADDLASELRALGVAAVASTAFKTSNTVPSGLRLCLGGALTREDCGRALDAVITRLNFLSMTSQK